MSIWDIMNWHKKLKIKAYVSIWKMFHNCFLKFVAHINVKKQIFLRFIPSYIMIENTNILHPETSVFASSHISGKIYKVLKERGVCICVNLKLFFATDLKRYMF